MKQQNEKGYTLVELLAVIFILVAVGTIIASILTSVLRSSNKSTNTETVRANGNYAIAQMSRMIAYAQKVEGISIGDPNTYPDQFKTDCVSQTPGTTKYYYLKLKAFDSGTTTFACADSKIASRSGDIVDPNLVTYLVNPSLIAKCYFQCSQESAAAPAKIDIFLDLSAVSTAVFAESQATMHFETSVIARNNTDR
jgi:type II secretory pathway pseudopilin PulG